MTLRRGIVRARRLTKRRRAAPEEGPDWWTWVTAVLLQRSGGRCERDGCDLYQQGMERHHRMRRRDGGDRAANLLAVCPSCHRKIHAQPGVSRAMGWIVSAWENSLTEVQVYISGEWWYLDDEGGKGRAVHD